MQFGKLLNILLSFFENERRSLVRYEVFAQCQISEVSLCIFTMRNINERGCQLQALKNSVSYDFEKGEKYTLNVSPHMLTNNHVKLNDFTILANLVWVEKTDNVVRLGFKFSNPNSESFKKWLDFMAKDTSKKKSHKKRLL